MSAAPSRSTASETSPLLRQPSSSSLSSKSSQSDVSAAPDVVDKRISLLRGIFIIASLGLIVFLQACNFSLLTTTQSAIAADLDAFEEVTWFTSAYLVPMSSITPLAGRLSQIFSPRSCIFVASIFFSLGGLTTAFAHTVEWFLFGRALTGLGGAGILSLTIIIVLQVGGEKRRGLLLGCVNSVVTSGVSLGAVLGGAIEPNLGWRAVFWLQTPLAVLAGIVLFLSIPSHLGAGKGDARSLKQKLSQIDYIGAATLTGAITALLISLSGPSILLIPLIISLILIPAFVLIELYLARDPIIPITLLKSRGTALTCLATLGFMMSRWSVLFYTPVYALGVRLWSPAAAGSILIPTNLGFGSGGLLAGVLHIRRAGSFYLPTLITVSLFPVTLLALGLASTAAVPAPLYVVLTFLNGLTTGAAINYALVHALHLVPPETHFVLTSLIATFRGFAGSFGSAIGGGIFSRLLADSLARNFARRGLADEKELIRRLLGSPALVARLSGVEQAVAIKGYEDALRGLFLAAVALGVVTIAVQAGTGWKGYDEQGREVRRHDDESAEERRREREDEEIGEAAAA
ncbi:Major facilitator superfamily [Macrophomina phaseolina MS6]|uniref:Major facilitator superfamily n=1 Tax=Macrophomina phaseolina (strain MS6) TaxID=1126212 RepID=K2RU87_MACPH|nr:Major facilitator superfamily [Macrophomina phaseolina MS6]